MNKKEKESIKKSKPGEDVLVGENNTSMKRYGVIDMQNKTTLTCYFWTVNRQEPAKVELKQNQTTKMKKSIKSMNHTCLMKP